MSVPNDIADALVAFLNAGDYALKFEAKRLIFPDAEVVEADGLLVSVFTGPRTAERYTRGSYQREYVIYLVVQKKVTAVAANLVGDADELGDLVEEIELSIEGVDMAGVGNTGYDTSTERLPYNLEAIRQAGVYAAIVGLTYEAVG